jgi:hypothetical protein
MTVWLLGSLFSIIVILSVKQLLLSLILKEKKCKYYGIQMYRVYCA